MFIRKTQSGLELREQRQRQNGLMQPRPQRIFFLKIALGTRLGLIGLSKRNI